MKKLVFIVALASVFPFAQPGLSAADECEPPKPVKIAGVFCGRVFDIAGAALPDVELNLIDRDGKAAANAHANDKGDFVFPRLQKGFYKVSPTKWQLPGLIEVTGYASSCKPVSVVVAVSSCQGGIYKKRPPRAR